MLMPKILYEIPSKGYYSRVRRHHRAKEKTKMDKAMLKAVNEMADGRVCYRIPLPIGSGVSTGETVATKRVPAELDDGYSLQGVWELDRHKDKPLPELEAFLTELFYSVDILYK